MSEILSEHHPVVDAEFVEWLNVSGDTLAWGDACWPPDHTLVHHLAQVPLASWIPADVLDGPGLWDVQTDLRLINSAGHVTLHRPDGVPVASSSYSDWGSADPRMSARETAQCGEISVGAPPIPLGACRQDGWSSWPIPSRQSNPFNRDGAFKTGIG